MMLWEGVLKSGIFNRLSVSSSLIGISIACLPAAAAAQTEAQQIQAAQTDDDAVAETGTNTIVVTGSRIPRANFDTLQPAQLLNSQQLEDRGSTNIADALNELPAFGNAPSRRGDNQLEFNLGQSFVNFFSLGTQRTLSLWGLWIASKRSQRVERRSMVRTRLPAPLTY
jgi:outer membrane receptor protein involved in Fe transport